MLLIHKDSHMRVDFIFIWIISSFLSGTFICRIQIHVVYDVHQLPATVPCVDLHFYKRYIYIYIKSISIITAPVSSATRRCGIITQRPHLDAKIPPPPLCLYIVCDMALCKMAPWRMVTGSWQFAMPWKYRATAHKITKSDNNTLEGN